MRQTRLAWRPIAEVNVQAGEWEVERPVFDVSVRYEVNGRQVSESEMWRHLESEIHRIGADAVKKAAARAALTPCPEHGERAKVTLKAAEGDVSVQPETCCEAETERFQERLQRELR